MKAVYVFLALASAWCAVIFTMLSGLGFGVTFLGLAVYGLFRAEHC
jgi:hypothetical protein